MANGNVTQFALIAVFAALLVVLLIYRKRASRAEIRELEPPVRPPAPKPQRMQPKPLQAAATPTPIEREQPQAPAVKLQTETVRASVTEPIGAVMTPATAVEKQPTFVLDVQGALTQEDRNERILAGISENIKKSLQSRPVPQHSPIMYTDSKPRNTEYVRVKKEIITPHGQIRFSILKDWMSTNMLAVFRRASLDWKTPEDLIAFIPAYLEAEAEILNNEVLLIGTPGHNEKLAVPIRSLDAQSTLGDCFEFVGDARTASNAPAVLLPLENDFEVVSKGVITKTVLANAVEQDRSEVLQQRYSAALRQMKPSMATDYSG